MSKNKKRKWWQGKNKKSKAQQRRDNYTSKKGKNMSIDKTNKVTPIAAGRELTDAEFEQLKSQHDKGGAFKQAPARQGCWDAGIEILPSCRKFEIPKFHIEFELLAHQKINKLKAYYPRLEWLAYLVGVVDRENNKVTVEDLVIPDSQQVTGVSVYNVEYEWGALPDGKQIIGVIHSHHTMGAFFSGTDDAYINQNHDVSIVVATAKGREIKSQVRCKVPCGAYVLAEDITYSVKYPQVLDEEAFEAEFKDKINTYTYPVISYSAGAGYLGNLSRGYLGRGSYYGGNVYGGRGAGNPSRNYQPDLYEEEDYSWVEELEDDDYPNPFTMGELDVIDHLLDYYEEDEVEEFIKKGLKTAQQELYIVQQLCIEGMSIRESFEDSEIIELDDEEEDSWDTGEHVHEQSANVARGIPLKDQEDDASGWCTDAEVDTPEQNLYNETQDEGITVRELVHTKNGVIIRPKGSDKTTKH